MINLTDMNFPAALRTKRRLLVLFTAKFAGPARVAEERFVEAAESSNETTCALFDLEDNPKVPARYGVRAVPTFILFVDGVPHVDGVVAGAVSMEVIKALIDGT